MIKSILFVLTFSLLYNTSYSNEIGEITVYKIPRFVSLKSDQVNLRIGSSTNYPIILKYVTKNMPVEITDEYARWRKIRDMHGNEGWISKDLLKGDRFVIIIKNNKSKIHMYSKPNGVPLGEIGELEMIVISSRDPAPPGLDYLNAAGGFFRDTTIHDFDLSRFILGEDPIIQVSAFGDNLFDENVKKAADFDTAMFILKSKAGVLIHINNSRRAVYGYDQRVEIFGSKGMMISNNQTPTSVQKFSEKNTESKDPIHYFFIERYEQAYRDQFNDFVETIKNNSNPSVSLEDGRNALILANAAYESYNSGRVIDITYD